LPIDVEDVAARPGRAQSDQVSFAVGESAQRSPRAQRVQRADGCLRSQEILSPRIVDAEPRKNAAERVAAADLLFAPIAAFNRRGNDRRRLEVAHDPFGRHAFERRVGREPERADDPCQHERCSGAHARDGGAESKRGRALR
jgi:hypothetical protein